MHFVNASRTVFSKFRTVQMLTSRHHLRCLQQIPYNTNPNFSTSPTLSVFSKLPTVRTLLESVIRVIFSKLRTVQILLEVTCCLQQVTYSTNPSRGHLLSSVSYIQYKSFPGGHLCCLQQVTYSTNPSRGHLCCLQQVIYSTVTYSTNPSRGHLLSSASYVQ